MAYFYKTVRPFCKAVCAVVGFIALLPLHPLHPLHRAAIAQTGSSSSQCSATVYLTLDTGNMSQAELVARVLKKHDLKVTFFLANEKTNLKAGGSDYSLSDSWQNYWQERAAEGHAFGNHTYDHVYFKGASSVNVLSAKPQFGANAGQLLNLTNAQFCSELNRVALRFKQLTGKSLDPVWRAPGGKAPQAVMNAASACGYQHVYWDSAGFLGDELSSETHPNSILLSNALASIKDGDILMAHLGIWSRKDPWAPAVLDPLITGLKAKGFCFATLRSHPKYR